MPKASSAYGYPSTRPAKQSAAWLPIYQTTHNYLVPYYLSRPVVSSRGDTLLTLGDREGFPRPAETSARNFQERSDYTSNGVLPSQPRCSSHTQEVADHPKAQYCHERDYVSAQLARVPQRTFDPCYVVRKKKLQMHIEPRGITKADIGRVTFDLLGRKPGTGIMMSLLERSDIDTWIVDGLRPLDWGDIQTRSRKLPNSISLSINFATQEKQRFEIWGAEIGLDDMWLVSLYQMSGRVWFAEICVPAYIH
ncbi:hypothetical protein IEO21_07109 [Rhodonia placenta]|uniref:Uncharacterized protein n=1 Tax=Rhodonia placenta TaxID=104341 RepID=A0A8H7NZ01_9APHY|nr:hypothetical protein IEO21_07109 [Postia placenta]